MISSKTTKSYLHTYRLNVHGYVKNRHAGEKIYTFNPQYFFHIANSSCGFRL